MEHSHKCRICEREFPHPEMTFGECLIDYIGVCEECIK